MHNSWFEFVVSPRSARGFFVRRVLVVAVVAGLGMVVWRPLEAWADGVAKGLVEATTPQHIVTTNDVSGEEVRSERQEVSQAEDKVQPRVTTVSQAPDFEATRAVAREQIAENEASQSVENPLRLSEVVTNQTATETAGTVASQSVPQPAFRYQLVVNGSQSYSAESQHAFTVLQLMRQLAAQGLVFEAEQYDYGVFITGINGVANSSSTREYWTYSVNGRSATVGADQLELKDGDIVSWNYVKT
jgi:hypothetical protein